VCDPQSDPAFVELIGKREDFLDRAAETVEFPYGQLVAGP
jgi:hypothetical protein